MKPSLYIYPKDLEYYLNVYKRKLSTEHILCKFDWCNDLEQGYLLDQLINSDILNNYQLRIVVPMPLHNTELINVTDHIDWYKIFDKSLELCKLREDTRIITGCNWDEYNIDNFFNKSLIKTIFDRVRKHGIGLDRLTWLYCNPFAPEWMQNYLENERGPQTIFHSDFLLQLQRVDEIYRPTISLDNKTHWFLSLNRIARIHRIGLCYWWFTNKNKPSYISCRLANGPSDDLSQDWSNLNGFERLKNKLFAYDSSFTIERYNKFTESLPWSIDFQNNNKALPIKQLNNLDKNIVESSACYIATETHYPFVESDVNFKGWISEKSFKTFFYGLPCIYIGAPETIKSLKKIGFESFSDLINEDYDDETSGMKRFKMVLSEIDRIQKIDDINAWYRTGYDIYQQNYDNLQRLTNLDIKKTIEQFDVNGSNQY